MGVTSDGRGNVIVADTGNDRIEQFAPGGRLEFSVGSSGSGVGQFSSPEAVAAGPSGAIYVADTDNDRVVELAPDGSFVRAWGVRGGSDGHFRGPDGVAVDSAGDVYVSDSGNNRIQEFSSSGRFITAWGARGSGPGELIDPGGLTVDCRGNVIVADTLNNRLQVFTALAPAVPCAAPLTITPATPAPALKVSLVHRRGVLAHREVVVVVRCDRACRVTPHLRVSVRSKGRARTTVSVRPRTLRAGVRKHIRFKLSARGIAILERALGAHRRSLTARITLVATSVVPAGTAPSTTTTYNRRVALAR
jgi:hypothetical protein